MLGLNILKILLNDNFKQILIRKHHREVAQFWTCLNFVEIIENKVVNNELGDSALNNILLDLFTMYLSLIDTLHKSNDFDASQHLYYIINWALRYLLSYIYIYMYITYVCCNFICNPLFFVLEL